MKNQPRVASPKINPTVTSSNPSESFFDDQFSKVAAASLPSGSKVERGKADSNRMDRIRGRAPCNPRESVRRRSGSVTISASLAPYSLGHRSAWPWLCDGSPVSGVTSSLAAASRESSSLNLVKRSDPWRSLHSQLRPAPRLSRCHVCDLSIEIGRCKNAA